MRNREYIFLDICCPLTPTFNQSIVFVTFGLLLFDFHSIVIVILIVYTSVNGKIKSTKIHQCKRIPLIK